MKKVVAISAALAALPLAMQSAAKAEPLSWTEVGIGWNMADSGDDMVDAFDIRASLGLGMFHGVLSYMDGGEGGTSGFDFDGYEVRAGIHPNVTENTQVVFDIMYFDYTADPDFTTTDFNEDGYGLGFGVRQKLGDNFEMRVQADWYDGTWEPDGGTSFDYSNTAVSISGRYYFGSRIFAGVGVALNGAEALSAAGVDGDVIRIEGGWSFGGDVL